MREDVKGAIAGSSMDTTQAPSGFLAAVRCESLPEPVVARVPWHVDGNAVTVMRRAPLLGEHNPFVLQGLLWVTPRAA